MKMNFEFVMLVQILLEFWNLVECTDSSLTIRTEFGRLEIVLIVCKLELLLIHVELDRNQT